MEMPLLSQPPPATLNAVVSLSDIQHLQQQQQDVGAIIQRNDTAATTTTSVSPVSPHGPVPLLDNEDQNPPSEFVYVDLLAVRKEVQCPICLGIIKKTRTVMECLHRFCRECIDKSMRMGNKECPACRTHCASRRSLRDDPRFDELIAVLYPDIKKFEEGELAFYEEDESRNKQIQDSIVQVIAKQTEALGKKRSGRKDAVGPSDVRSQRNFTSTQLSRRRRRRISSTDYQDSDDSVEANYNKHLSTDLHHLNTVPKKRKQNENDDPSQSPSTNVKGVFLEDNLEKCKKQRGFSPGLTCNPEMLAWGRGGVRSTTHHGNTSTSMNRSARCIRLTNFVDFLHNMEGNDNEGMAQGTPLENENAQLTGMQESNGLSDEQATYQPFTFDKERLSEVAESLQDKFHALDRDEKHLGALSSCNPNGEQLVSAYQQKEAI